MSTLRVVTRLTASLGSEEVRAESDQGFGLASNVKHDVQKVLLAAAADGTVVFWASTDGPATFDALAIIVDPDEQYLTEKLLSLKMTIDGVDVGLTLTSRTIFLLGDSVAGSGVDPEQNLNGAITAIALRNEDLADPITARVIVLG